MNILPQALLAHPQVRVLLHADEVIGLERTLAETVRAKEGYLAKHVIAVVLAGEQQIRTPDDRMFVVREGDLLAAPHGLYHISDLLAENRTFRALLFYFEDTVVHAFLREDPFQPDPIRYITDLFS